MQGSNSRVSPLSSRDAPNSYGSEEGDETSARSNRAATPLIHYRLASPVERAAREMFDSARSNPSRSSPTAVHVTRRQPGRSLPIGGEEAAEPMAQRIQAQEQTLRLAEQALRLAELEHQTAQMQLATATARQAIAATNAQSPRGSVRSELSSGGSAASDHAERRPILSQRQSTASTWQQPAAEGRRSYKVGLALKDFRCYSGASPDGPVGVFLRDLFEELDEKLVDRDHWGRELAAKCTGMAKGHLRSKIDEWRRTAEGDAQRYRNDSEAYPPLELIVSWLRLRFDERWSASKYVRALETFTRTPGSSGADALQQLREREAMVLAAGVPPNMSIEERQFHRAMDALTATESIAFKQQADAYTDCNEEALARVSAQTYYGPGSAYIAPGNNTARTDIFTKRLHLVTSFLNMSGRSGKAATPGMDTRGSSAYAAVMEITVPAPPATPQSPADSPRAAELLAIADEREANLCAIIEGRLTRAQRSLGPSTGGPLANFPAYGTTEPANKTEFLRRRDNKLCYACNSHKAECKSGGDVWKYVLCPHHGPRVNQATLDAARHNGLSVKGAGGRDGRAK